jgi:hypothetical protein
MKKFVKFLGIAAFIAVICFSITACPDPEEDDSTAFDGTWVGNIQEEGTTVTIKIVAGEGKWTLSMFFLVDIGMYRGTFTVTGNDVILTIVEINEVDFFGGSIENWVSYANSTDEDKPPEKWNGTISDNTFTISGMGMTFTKQP